MQSPTNHDREKKKRGGEKRKNGEELVCKEKCNFRKRKKKEAEKVDALF